MLSYPARRRLAAWLLTSAATLLAAGSVHAVVMLDGTWRDAGGSPGHEAAGFGPLIDLANQPQFDALMSFSEDDGETWGVASGTWIGNDRRSGYVLTAGHNFDEDYAPDDYLYRSQGGTLYEGEELFVHPLWNGKQEERSGFDFAIVRLSTPVTDAGRPPVLYAGRYEAGRLGTMIGFGSRGIGSVGERDEYYEGGDKAAAQNWLDEVADPLDPIPDEPDETAGNEISVDFDAEDGSAENSYGDPVPASPLEGVLGSGDSGGSLWAEFSGGWRLIGVNSSGTADTYGATSHFARVSTQIEWIRRVFPGVRVGR